MAKADYLDSLAERKRLVDHVDVDGIVNEAPRPSESRSCANEETCQFGDHARMAGYPCSICRFLIMGDFFAGKE